MLPRKSTKDGGKPDHATGMLGASLTEARSGKALSDRPALEPYWGKPAVRNLRGDDGNVGIIRSPLRAIVLPDHRFVIATPTPLAWRKAVSAGPIERGLEEPPESLARGTCSQGFPRNLGETSRFRQPKWMQVAPTKGDRRKSATDEEETYEPVVLMTTGNQKLRCPGTRTREGGNKTTHRSKETLRYTDIEEECQQNLNE